MVVTSGHACDLLTSSATMIPIITTRLIWPEITRDNHDDTPRSRLTGAGCWWLLMVPDVDMETLVVFAAP